MANDGKRFLADAFKDTATEPVYEQFSDGNKHSHLGTALAGERNPGSATNSYLVGRDECNLTIIDIQTAITIGAGAANDTHLIGVLITTALTGTCVITGFEGSAGTAISITLPAGSAVGFHDFKGAINSIGALTVTCSNAADDNDVQILWRPI